MLNAAKRTIRYIWRRFNTTPSPLFTHPIPTEASIADEVWGRAYRIYEKVLLAHGVKVGVEIGVAFGGHSEYMLKNVQTLERLYGVIPYRHQRNYADPMNIGQKQFDQLHDFAMQRLNPYGTRYQHIRKFSSDAVLDIQAPIDFVYIDGDHSYAGVLNDINMWFKVVRVGGIISGHDYNHPNFPGVKQAVEEYFNRFDWEIHEEGEGVWWVQKQPLNISFIIPAYNCAHTLRESVESIIHTNLSQGDEIVICDDASTDSTPQLIEELKNHYPVIRSITHSQNKGGAAARNTAVTHARYDLIFCLDSDNVLIPNSVPSLKDFLLSSNADVASFERLHYFIDTTENVTHQWIFPSGQIKLADALCSYIVPPASGNYLYTRLSWKKAGMYPESARALDAWGFGFRQLATDSRMVVQPHTFYFHRHGTESYFVRESRNGTMSEIAFNIIAPFIDRIEDTDLEHLKTKTWFEMLPERPIHVKGQKGRKGTVSDRSKPSIPTRVFNKLLRSIKGK